MHKVQIYRVDKSLPLPRYYNEGSVGLDLYSRVNCVVEPKDIILLPSNIVINTPEGYMFYIRPRSSTPRRLGVTLIGSNVVDPGYNGPKDEVLLQVYNFSNKTVKIPKGERIAQGIFVRVDRFTLAEVDKISGENRGGLGSTGEC